MLKATLEALNNLDASRRRYDEVRIEARARALTAIIDCEQLARSLGKPVTDSSTPWRAKAFEEAVGKIQAETHEMEDLAVVEQALMRLVSLAERQTKTNFDMAETVSEMFELSRS